MFPFSRNRSSSRKHASCSGGIGFVFEEDFADYGSHTNAIGAEKCTDFLEQYLIEHYEFQDKRGDDRYDSWNHAYILWQEDMETARKTIRERIVNEDYAIIEEE